MASMVVSRRTAVCAWAAGGSGHEHTTVAKIATIVADSRLTYLFYFAHRRPRDDDGQREEEEGGRHFAGYAVAVHERDEIADALERPDRIGADQHREEDPGNRPARN